MSCKLEELYNKSVKFPEIDGFVEYNINRSLRCQQFQTCKLGYKYWNYLKVNVGIDHLLVTVDNYDRFPVVNIVS